MKRVALSALLILVLLASLPAKASDSALYTIHLPAIAGNPSCTPLAPTLFGVQMYGDTRKSNPYYPFLIQSGAHWVRVPIPWNKVEPRNVKPDKYDWSYADRVVGAVHDGCMNMIVTHGSDPAWAESNTDVPLDKKGVAELAEYLGALVERYDGDGLQDAPGSPIVRHWELYNEPDDTVPLYGGRWGYAGKEYAEMLAVVYPVMKAADPQAQVLFGGIAYDRYEDLPSPFSKSFLDDVLRAGGGAYFDIMNFHSYPPYATNWATQGPGLYEKTQYIRSKLAQYGLDKPIMITETAHHSNMALGGLRGSHEMQMRFVAQLYTQALAADVRVLIWFSLVEPGGDYPYNSGLVTLPPQISAKPAFAVYQIAAAKLGNARFVRRLTLDETRLAAMEAYEFVDDARAPSLTVAWIDPVESEETALLVLQGQQAIVTDIGGQVTVVRDIDDGHQDGHVSIEVSGRPIYITIAQ